MGNWNINIQGNGCHHNGNPEIDADLQAAEFAAFLRDKGHTIESASFTHGSKTNLIPTTDNESGSVGISDAGGSKTFSATVKEKCGWCEGVGDITEVGMIVECPACHGTGIVEREIPDQPNPMDDPNHPCQ